MVSWKTPVNVGAPVAQHLDDHGLGRNPLLPTKKSGTGCTVPLRDLLFGVLYCFSLPFFSFFALAAFLAFLPAR